MRNNRTNGHIFLTIVLGLACMITSCERSTSTGTSTSSVAQLSAFSFNAQDFIMNVWSAWNKTPKLYDDIVIFRQQK